MAASKDKASALKNSYVDGIINELGGASDPAVRMAIREGDQASIHSFPESGKAGVINDGDPGLYIHSNEKSYLGDTNPEYANPIKGGANGERQLFDAPEDAQKEGEAYLNKMDRRMGGTGDMARMRPKTKEDYERKPKVLGSAGGFDSSNLAGRMGMEQGNTAGIAIDVVSGIRAAANDGNPRVFITDGNRSVTYNGGQGAGFPLRNGGYGQSHVDKLSPRGAMSAAQDLHSGNTMPEFSSTRNKNVKDFYDYGMGQNFTYGR